MWQAKSKVYIQHKYSNVLSEKHKFCLLVESLLELVGIKQLKILDKSKLKTSTYSVLSSFVDSDSDRYLFVVTDNVVPSDTDIY